MNTDQKRPMSEDQLDYFKNEIKNTYLYLIGHTTYDPEVIEIMKLAALADVRDGMRLVSRGDFLPSIETINNLNNRMISETYHHTFR